MRDFTRAESGNVGMMLAIGLFVMLGAIGAMTDYLRMSAVQNDLQSAIDNGVLAAASHDSRSDQVRRQYGETVALGNSALTHAGDVEIDIQVGSDGVVTGVGRAVYQPLMMQMFGYETLDVSVNAQAGSEDTYADIELALVLDYSSSMNDHYEAMRDAAVDLVITLEDGGDNDLSVALVPFAEEVYMEMDGRYAVGGSPGTTWRDCTFSRKWPFVVSDRTPNGSANSKWGHMGTDCADYPALSLVVRPLDSNIPGVVAQLRAMVPLGGTNTSLGAEIGYQVLSPNLPFAASRSSEGKSKYMVILSDGELTRGSYGPGNRFDTDQAWSNLQRVCDRAASDGISVITVIYETTDSDAIDAMRGCASSPSLYIQATSGNIAAQFAEIAEFVKSDVRLTR